MNNTKKISSIFLAMLLVISLFSSMTTAFAATIETVQNDDIRLSVSRSGNEITVSIIANKDLNLGGIGFFHRTDGKTSFTSYIANSIFAVNGRNPEISMVGLSGTGKKTTSANTVLASFTYVTNDPFEKDTDYTFYFDMDMAFQFDDAQTDYSWDTATFTITYAEHTVTFYDEDGTTVLDDSQNEAITGDAAVYSKETPTKAADDSYTYEFKGWSATKGDSVENAKQVAELPAVGDTSVSYYAIYDKTPIEYTITYDLDDGALADDSSNPETYTVESENITLNNPTKTGYTFAGWTGTDLEAATETVTIPTGSTGNRTYTATWTPAGVTYTVKHFQQNLDGNDYTEVTADQETKNGTTDAQTEAEAKSYTGFTAQPIEQQTIAADGSTIVNVYYDRNKHNVTYSVTGDAPSGATVPEGRTNVLYGAEITVAEALTTDAAVNASGVPGTWEFSGWSRTGTFTMPDEDVTITGSWTFTPTTYTVKWVDEDGTVLETDENVAYNATPTYDSATPTKEATAEYTYTFDGWDPTVSPVIEDVTYTAKYTQTKNQYTVTFVDEDGTTVLKAATAYDYGTAAADIAKPADPTKAATAEKTYTFAGWTPEITTVTGDVTYTATYSEVTNAYTVTWKNEDGTVLETDENVPYGTMPSYDGATPTKDATAEHTYVFASWKPTVSTVTGDVTYTATFMEAARTYTITWQNEDGTTLETDTGVAYGATPSYDSATPTKASDGKNTYAFAGWTPAISSVTEDATYTATFTATPIPTYTITFVDEDGTTVLQTVTVKEGQTPVYTGTAPTKAEDDDHTYTFNGWDKPIVPATANATYKATYRVTDKDKYNLIDPALEQPTGYYTITWLNYDGTLIDTTYVESGKVPAHADPAVPEVEGKIYSFTGWSPTIVAATQNATYIATMSVKDAESDAEPTTLPIPEPSHPATVTITWLNYDGSFIEKTTVEYNSTPSHADPTKVPSEEGKTFAFKGWSPTIAAATTDATYTAQFTGTDEEGSETDTVVPTPPVTPENPDTNPTSHIDPPSITTVSHTYEVYQIFTGDYAELDGKDVLANIKWGQNGKGTEGTTTTDPETRETITTGGTSIGDPVPQSVLDALNAVLNEELDRTKLDVIEQYVNIDPDSKFAQITLGEGNTENSIQLPPGYYLIRDVAGSHSGDNQDHDAYTTYITVVIKDYTIQPKSVIPSVDKQVYDNEDAGGNGAGWAETADHAINESFQFAIIGTIPNNAHLKDYTNGYTVKFTDTMSAGVTFENIQSVTVNGTDAANKYTVTGVENGTAGGTMVLTMNVKEILGDDFGTSAINVIVTYNAHLNEDAIVHTASATATNTNENSVYMEYSNNPNTGGSGDKGKTETDNVWVFTYKVENTKMANSTTGSPLAGAGFTLYKGETAIKLIKGADGNYRVADQQATGDDIVTEMITESNGVFNIIGLDAGTYILRETTVPAGYNALPDDTTITITASHEENTSGASANLALVGTNMNNTIVNNSGSVLPSTGGIGTTIFYTVGSVLLITAGVLLVTKKRMKDRDEA